MNELSSIAPSAHQPALFLIQEGITPSLTEIVPIIQGCKVQKYEKLPIFSNLYEKLSDGAIIPLSKNSKIPFSGLPEVTV